MKNECLEPTTDLNESLVIPEVYNPYLNLIETEEAIKKVKDVFQKNIAEKLNLYRVSAPIAVLSKSGINDALNGTERPICFEVKDINENAEIVHSLAKWKRLALSDYGFKPGEGLYTDMNALRPDEELDNLHSIYVDQWDWEKVIIKEERNLEFLKNTVKVIYDSLKDTEKEICNIYKKLPSQILPDEIYFIHTEELEEKYPYLSPKERENIICEEKKAVFIIGIGGELKNGHPHDGRAADYDDWITETSEGKKGLNGDMSSGAAMYAAVELAKEIESGVIVVMLPDRGEKYLSTSLFE